MIVTATPHSGTSSIEFTSTDPRTDYTLAQVLSDCRIAHSSPAQAYLDHTLSKSVNRPSLAYGGYLVLGVTKHEYPNRRQLATSLEQLSQLLGDDWGNRTIL